jgi:hypothetical protein
MTRMRSPADRVIIGTALAGTAIDTLGLTGVSSMRFVPDLALEESDANPTHDSTWSPL